MVASAGIGPDVFGQTISDGNNLIGDATGSTGFVDGINGDKIGDSANPINAMLGPLQNNGGPTETYALLSGSPAIDMGDDADAPLTDQRGVIRPQGPASDIGAFESDPTPPLCKVQGVNIAHPAPPSNLLVHVQDLGSGLSTVNTLTQDNIGNVTFTPAITAGTNDLIEIVADKADDGSQARFQIEVFDIDGNRSECDPLLVTLDRSPISPRFSTYDGISQADRYFTISNTGESILTYALVNVNDRWFIMPTLLPYEVKTIDIGSALVAGANNTITVWGGGHGSQVMISDVIPRVTNTFVYPDEPLY